MPQRPCSSAVLPIMLVPNRRCTTANERMPYSQTNWPIKYPFRSFYARISFYLTRVPCLLMSDFYFLIILVARWQQDKITSECAIEIWNLLLL